MKSPGQIAYEAYCGTTNWKSFRGEDLPQWENVKPQIKQGWETAGYRVLFEFLSYPDIGPDPLKSGEKDPDHDEGMERIFQAMSVQQNGVPDQTALTWRIDLSRLHGELTWRRAAMKGMIGRVAHEIASRIPAMQADCATNNAEVIERLIIDGLKVGGK